VDELAMTNLWFGLTRAVRPFMARPLLTFLLTITLAIGVGAVSAVFMVAYSVLLKPLPYSKADEVAMVWRKPQNRPSAMAGFRDDADLVRQVFTASMVRTLREGNQTLIDVAAIESWRTSLAAQVDLIGGAGAERLRAAFVTPNFFSLLGSSPALGQWFSSGPSDEVVVSHALWRQRFGGDPNIVGRKVEVSSGRERQRHLVTIVGVLEPSFQFTYPDATDLFIREPWERVELGNQMALRYQVLTRRKPGATWQQTAKDVAGVLEAWGATLQVPEGRRETAWVEPIHEYSFGKVRPVLNLLGGICLLVLLIGCISAANLLLAQTSARQREIQTHRHLGATSAQLVRRLATETAALATTAALPVIVALWMFQSALRLLVPVATPRAGELELTAATIAFAFVVCALVVLLAGFVPALFGIAGAVTSLPYGSSTSTTGTRGVRARQVLIAVQAAAIMPLLVASGLLLHSFWNLSQVDPGFEADRVLIAEMRLLNPRYRSPEQIGIFERVLLERSKALDGVREAAITSAVPLRGVDFMRSIRHPDGAPLLVNERRVDPDYFTVLRVPLLSGRIFSSVDRGSSEPVAMLSASLARILFPAGGAIGQTVDAAGKRTVVGVVGDIRSRRIDEAAKPALYVPRAQAPSELVCLMLLVSRDHDQVRAALPSLVKSIDPEQPVQGINTLSAVMADSIGDRKVYATVAGILAGIMLILTACGVCGVLFQLVTERTRELGIRAAVGASPYEQIRAVMMQGMKPLAVGIVTGALASLGVSRVLGSYLFGLGTVDPIAFGLAVTGLFITGLLGCYLPGRRAALLDTMVALRCD